MKRSQTFNEAPLPLFAGEEAVQTLGSNRLPSYIKGHRKRLRDRFMDRGDGALADYELLELILFRTFKNGDVKPVANRLMERFKSLDRVISAPTHLLAEVKGCGAATILDLKILEATARRMARSVVIEKQVLSGWNALLDYCHTVMAHRDKEHFRLLFLDRKNVLIADEEQAQGTVDHVPVYPREVVKRALELQASAIILVHNHPSGDPTPSEADIRMTKAIEDACTVLGITLHDHLIIGKGEELSMRSHGYL